MNSQLKEVFIYLTGYTEKNLKEILYYNNIKNHLSIENFPFSHNTSV